MYMVIADDQVRWRIIDSADGAYYDRPEEDALAEASRALGLPPEDIQVWPVPAGQEDAYRAAALEAMTVRRDDQGQITAVELPRQLWLHLDISGGDGDDPPGIKNDGAHALAISAALRASEDPDSPLVEVDGDWRITIRDDTGAIYDVVKVSMTSGRVTISYTTSARPALCRLDESDFAPLPDPAGGAPYTIRLAGQTRWKVYRTL